MTWRKRTIMEMAPDCGINFHQAGWPELERFAALVRADERKKFCAVLRQLHDSYSLASNSNNIRARGQA